MAKNLGQIRPVVPQIDLVDSFNRLIEKIDRNTESNSESIIQLKINNAYLAEGFDDEITADDVK